MCETCGCGEASRAHANVLRPAAGHAAAIGPLPNVQPVHPGAGRAPAEADGARRVALGRAVLAHNDALAADNRAWLAARGVRMVDLISSPGSGKTALLEATLDALAGRRRVAVIVGDPETDRDAQRLRGRGAEVRQVETGGACHLDAAHVGRLLPELAGDGLDLLVVENVGNLVCPAAFDLGQSLRVALLSVTEGEDKPLKYPALFHRAAVVVLSKVDLIPHLRWDRAACLANLRRVRPDVRVLEVSAWTGAGLAEWLAVLTGTEG